MQMVEIECYFGQQWWTDIAVGNESKLTKAFHCDKTVGTQGVQMVYESDKDKRSYLFDQPCNQTNVIRHGLMP